MGFQLIGISKVFEAETKEKLKKNFEDALSDHNIGILVTNDRTLNRLDQNFKRQVENSITPVVVTLTTSTGAQENLREMIKKAIGIDLWSR
jgi:V/A-type H+-transporting ATPase subunit F